MNSQLCLLFVPHLTLRSCCGWMALSVILRRDIGSEYLHKVEANKMAVNLDAYPTRIRTEENQTPKWIKGSHNWTFAPSWSKAITQFGQILARLFKH